MDRLKGKVVAVTGATKGIGRDIAKALAGEGANVAIGGRSAAEGKAVARQIIDETGIDAIYIPCDVAVEEDCRNFIGKTYESFGGIDGLVNNAGIFPPVPFFESDGELFDRVYATNIRGAFLCSKYAAMAMGDKGGSIVHIGSTHAFGASPHYSVYGTSKGALYSFGAYLARNMARKNIRSNCITVGWVATDGELERLRADGKDEDWLAEIGGKRMPLGRLQTGLDIAYAAIYLLSDESAQVTETDIKVTGGFQPTY